MQSPNSLNLLIEKMVYDEVDAVPVKLSGTCLPLGTGEIVGR